MALLDLRLIDIPAILRALYKYSSAHTRARPHESDQLEGNGEKEAAAGVDGKKKNKGKDEQGKQQPQKKILRWRNSYPAEVAVLVRLAPVLAKGTVPLNPRHVVQMLKVLVSWMALLVEAAAAISREAFGALGMVKDETERARGALARFMVVVAENQTVLATLAKPECKGMYALGAVRC
jgi:mediator of RNA polymerase II transcription subunit 5